ncbi:type I restriction endonuclease subunit R [Lacihabitans soyangensis]|uniref:Type I restriction endonuclease subunit R n=1 Tax=Lacihabitans soyangensis TaxID=869394 RepID=A0AAE3H114_9BACT|nr:DEAD/DEAH box helicase family protein [Lacihabitans soyangensis]MCP9762977.1 type I restriction endonuclease subunit R [Lacihabitans soyangensis]
MTEKRFEEYIENYLTSTHQNGLKYHSTNTNLYIRELGLVGSEVLAFVKATQPKAYENWQAHFGEQADEKLLKRLSTEIQANGVIRVLREGIRDKGVYFDMVYFEPKSGLNPEHQQKYLLNRLSVVRQLKYSLKNENSIDMVLCINGIPIIGLELKNQFTGQDINNAIHQYKFDRDPKNEPLLQFKRMLVHFVVDNDSVGMTSKLSGSETKFLPYNRGIVNPIVENDYKVSYLWKEVLSPESVLDIIENFALETTELEKEWDDKSGRVIEKKKELLIFPRYHQLDVIRNLRNQIKVDGTGHYYLIQHTTGSGKSYSIGWLAHTLTSLYKNPTEKTRIFDTVIVVTDRKVLDKQLQKTLKDLEQTAGVVKAIDKNSQQLKDALAKGNDIIVTTIQKFGVIADEMSKLRGRTFGVIIDEVHSSQTGETSKKLKKSLSVNLPQMNLAAEPEPIYGEEKEEEDFEDLITKDLLTRGKQEHISFFGFTGTPKNKTLELFGRKNEQGQFVPFHSYTMKQSIAEGYTLDVLEHFMPYKRWFKLKKEDDNDDLELPEGKVKRELVNYVDSHPETIRQKVAIMLNQFVNHTQKQIRGRARAMVVVRSRKHCVLFQQEMIKQMKDLRLPYSCLVAFSGSVHHEGSEHTESSLNSDNGLQHSVSIPDGLKDPRFRILIVSSKFQTGFDEPLIHTMFVDKRLGGVQAVQTLSRLNRKASGKTDTFVLDFVNEPEEIVMAFQPFYTSTFLSGETDSYKLYELETEVRKFQLYTKFEVDEFCKLFYEDRKFDQLLQTPIGRVVERWQAIEDESKREEFRSIINSYCRLYSYISQIMDFQDKELEKQFIFLKYLKKKLPKRKGSTLDITDSVDLDSLRIQKIGEMKLSLEDKEGSLDPMSESGTKGTKPEEIDLLSEIIRKVNEVHGLNLKEEDKVHLNNVYKRMSQSEEVQKVMQGDNSEANKKQYWNDMLSRFFLEYVNDNFDFYKTVESPDKKPIIADLMLRQFLRGNNL